MGTGCGGWGTSCGSCSVCAGACAGWAGACADGCVDCACIEVLGGIGGLVGAGWLLSMYLLEEAGEGSCVLVLCAL